ncbi:diaminobutyrate--2-oxoglutarate transaminase [Sediminicurvatus halobius]|uniref:Diaminobutyrate--2-oxoglutarate transaminase n=1 Tax=Sediminicurvatus halobius TaxID=2182432 RepID=A0A2U2N5T4_9GAMM|nr:diaminobutyrate--2-oxoglutarate transaminase [Spiribacter halobius]PWG64339.1 diaminobutyrate--2-oxoglutarate transaminase [Spiribacter halobius]UEX79315.1 diaminobutyrate--2-oxoglutarate transaminase [Spiribacter halobius]
MDFLNTIDRYESEVRSYVRSFPTVFEKARGSWMYDIDGNAYLDFFAGASVLNYGHNHPELKRALIDYLEADNITHSLDMASVARAEFLKAFNDIILEPRGMNHRIQFPGPTGTNAVESALKIARKAKGRPGVIAFTNAFHGMTLGALSVTGNQFKRDGAGVPLSHTDSMPYDSYFGGDVDTIDYLDKLLTDGGSGVGHPAAVIVETIQAEGGVNVASGEWLQRLQDVCRRHDMLFMIDDIQTGNGRTGRFFSFEEYDLDPDVVTVSKSISGYGLPLALVLVKPEFDIWEPGEHNGTFRGFNPAMITAKRALELFWSDQRFSREVEAKGERMRRFLEGLTERYPQARGCVRGRGMMQAVEFAHKELAGAISKRAFAHNLVIETAGPDDETLKLLPPLTTEEKDLERGLEIIEQALIEAMGEFGLSTAEAAGQ